MLLASYALLLVVTVALIASHAGREGVALDSGKVLTALSFLAAVFWKVEAAGVMLLTACALLALDSGRRWLIAFLVGGALAAVAGWAYHPGHEDGEGAPRRPFASVPWPTIHPPAPLSPQGCAKLKATGGGEE